MTLIMVIVEAWSYSDYKSLYDPFITLGDCKVNTILVSTLNLQSSHIHLVFIILDIDLDPSPYACLV